ncbi:MAG TPA: hypothetical protein VIK14_07885 [Ignavibacteria bacterium]|jgi:uncharacterized membrane protein
MTENQTQYNITPEEIESGKGMAAVAYILFWLPLVIEEHRKNKFVMFHTSQSIVLVIASVICGIIAFITCGIGAILFIPIFVFQIMGLINALQGVAKPLPLIGQFAEKFNLVK